MNAEAAFATLRAQVGDARLSVFGVALQQGALTGVSERAFEPLLTRFAQEHWLQLRVTFSDAGRRWLKVGRAAVYALPEATSEMVTEALLGEEVRAFDLQGGFVRVRLVHDRYVGWLPDSALTEAPPEPTHRVRVLRGHVFAEPRVAAPVVLELAYGVEVTATAEDDSWLTLRLPDGQVGFARRRVLEAVDAPLPEATPASLLRFAEGFMHAPYLWGGRTAWGLDCSGFVQTVFAAHGVFLPRDADQQQALGRALELGEARPGDLYFLPGHVMIARDPGRFIHANAQHMQVSVDSFRSDYGKSLEDRLTGARRVTGSEG